MSFAKETKQQFDQLAEFMFKQLTADEQAQLNLHAEETLFVRFNNNLVRQNTHVHQKEIGLIFQKENREIKIGFPMTGQFNWDSEKALAYLAMARKLATEIPEDPFIVPLKNNGHSESNLDGKILENEKVVSEITTIAEGTDFAGIYCAGPMITANKNSLGQNHWFSTENFFLDFSLYDHDKSAKSLYAGRVWNSQSFANQLLQAKENLALLKKPVVSIKPGAYRTYLAPGAVAELATMFAWGATSFAAFKQGRSSLQKLASQEKSFSKQLSLQENFELGLTPRFNSNGELSPEKLSIISNGQLDNWLISSRSAKEYGVEANFAESGEGPRSLEILPGDLQAPNILKTLGTGLYLSNLHYLNWSDRQNARITGMTRYACFWVENGEIVGPIKDLRFDESLFDALGENLVAITDFQHVEAAIGTYSQRSFGGVKIPGFLINNFKFTL